MLNISHVCLYWDISHELAHFRELEMTFGIKCAFCKHTLLCYKCILLYVPEVLAISQKLWDLHPKAAVGYKIQTSLCGSLYNRYIPM